MPRPRQHRRESPIAGQDATAEVVPLKLDDVVTVVLPEALFGSTALLQLLGYRSNLSRNAPTTDAFLEFAMSTDSSRVFLEKLEELESLRAAEIPADRRISPRVPVRGEAEMLAISGTSVTSNLLPIQIRDISWAGLGFLCSEKLVADSHWRICFMDHGEQMGQGRLMVRHCREVNEGICLAGGLFVIEASIPALFGVRTSELS